MWFGAHAMTKFTAAANSPDALAARLMAYADAGDYGAGLELGERRLPFVPPNAAVYHAMETLYFRADDFAGTREYALRTLELDPANEHAISMLLVICRDYGRYDEGLERGRAWIATNAGGADVYRHLALLADDNGDEVEAMGYAAEAHRRDPAQPRLASVYFYYALQFDGVDATGPKIDAWLADHEPDEFFYAQVGKGLSDAGAFAEALPHLRRALEMGSKDNSVLTESLDCYRGLRDVDGADDFAAEHASALATDPELLRVMGAIKYDVADYDAALGYFRRAQVLDPASAVTTANLIFTLYELQRSDEGIEEGQRWFRNYRKQRPTAAMHRSMGHVYYARDRYEEALTEYEAALRIEPSSVANAREAVSCLVALDRFAEAVSFGEDWLASHPTVAPDASFNQILARARAQAAAPDEPVVLVDKAPEIGAGPPGAAAKLTKTRPAFEVDDAAPADATAGAEELDTAAGDKDSADAPDDFI